MAENQLTHVEWNYKQTPKEADILANLVSTHYPKFSLDIIKFD